MVHVPLAVNSEMLTVAPAATVAKIAAPAPFAWRSCPEVAAPEPIAAVVTAWAMSWLEPTEVALRWVEFMLPATMDTVEVPDAVETEAGEVPMTALT